MCTENAEFIKLESELATDLGVDRSILKKIRRDCLDPGKDYALVGGKVTLSQEAICVVMGCLGVEVEPVMAEPEKTPPAQDLAVGTVCRIWPINRHVLDCRTDDGEVCRVRVRDNMMFVIGQEVPIKKTAGGYYTLGCRNPVKRGRLPWKRTL